VASRDSVVCLDSTPDRRNTSVTPSSLRRLVTHSWQYRAPGWRSIYLPDWVWPPSVVRRFHPSSLHHHRTSPPLSTSHSPTCRAPSRSDRPTSRSPTSSAAPSSPPWSSARLVRLQLP